jgi:putative ABC transport system permease protein
MFLDYLELALQNIRSRRLRSWLTILGIVIGVTAVVALIAIGQGMKKSIEQEFEAIGFDTILMFPGGLGGGQGGGPGGGGFFAGASQPIVLNLDALGRFPGQVEKYGFTRNETAMVKSPGFEGQGLLRVTGLSPGITDDFHGYFRGFSIGEGRGFQTEDRYAVILGNQVATDLKVTVEQEIEIDQKKFKVIGILAAIQARGGLGAGGINNALYIPVRAMAEMYSREKEKEGKEGVFASTVLIKAAKGAKVADVSNRVKAIMTRQGTPVNTVTAEEINNRINGVLGIMQMTLAAIAAISLLVGAIGVMNTMYTSVLERTREIGILKAVGAKDKHVLGLFLIESGLIGVIGGIIGIVCGVALSSGTSGFVGRALAIGPVGGGGFNPAFSVELIVGTLLFSFLLGAISGTLPARMAAQLRTVEALRYE